MKIRNLIPIISSITFSLPALATGDSNCVDRTRDAASVRQARERICELTNFERRKREAPPLVLDVKRSKVAQAHAYDMYRRDYFSHTSPEGEEPDDRLQSAGIDWRTWGENIARHPKGMPVDIESMWMNSSGHRRNILKKTFGRLGVGASYGYWVQVFTD
ncbi:MAG: CAP domain-containing protein [Bdellovibrionota bacterium]